MMALRQPGLKQRTTSEELVAILGCSREEDLDALDEGRAKKFVNCTDITETLDRSEWRAGKPVSSGCSFGWGKLATESDVQRLLVKPIKCALGLASLKNEFEVTEPRCRSWKSLGIESVFQYLWQNMQNQNLTC